MTEILLELTVGEISFEPQYILGERYEKPCPLVETPGSQLRLTGQGHNPKGLLEEPFYIIRRKPCIH